MATAGSPCATNRDCATGACTALACVTEPCPALCTDTGACVGGPLTCPNGLEVARDPEESCAFAPCPGVGSCAVNPSLPVGRLSLANGGA